MAIRDRRTNFIKKLRKVYVNLYGESVLDDCFIWDAYERGLLDDFTMRKYIIEVYQNHKNLLIDL